MFSTKSLTSVLGYVRFTLYRIELLFTHKNGDFGAIPKTKRSSAAPRRSLNTRVTQLIGVYAKPDYRVFSHDVTAAILVSQNNEMAAMLVSQTNPLGVELFSYANVFFCPNKFA